MKQRDKSACKTILVIFVILFAIIVSEAKERHQTERSRRFLPSNCGNGSIQTGNGEQCDDGNQIDGDGCNDNCYIESGWTCNGVPSVCQNCGNGKIEGTEVCDDGNSSSGDGCSSSCTLEAGWTCNGAVLSICQKCGNGIKEGTEVCDDGNINLFY